MACCADRITASPFAVIGRCCVYVCACTCAGASAGVGASACACALCVIMCAITHPSVCRVGVCDVTDGQSREAMQPQSLSRCVTSFMCHVHSELSIGVTSGHVSWFMPMCHAFTSVTSSLPQPTFIYVTSFVYWMEYWSHFRIRLVAHICVNYPCVTSPPSPIHVCHIIHGVYMRHVTLICDVM